MDGGRVDGGGTGGGGTGGGSAGGGRSGGGRCGGPGGDHRPVWDERRGGADRRSGRDRRGSGLRQPPSPVARPYGFRSFDGDRRSGYDRRLYGDDAAQWQPGAAAPGLSDSAAPRDALVIELTLAEIRCLLRRDED